MTKTGWWRVKIEITLEGEEIRFEDLDECSQRHILGCIMDGCRQGEVVEETDDEEDEMSDCDGECVGCDRYCADRISQYNESENMNKDNRNVLSVVDEARKLYGSSELSVDKTDDGMIDVNVVERYCDVQPYFSAVAHYDHCDVERLKEELDSRCVGYDL